VDIDVIRGAKLKLAVDPLGGAARLYWGPINSVYAFFQSLCNGEAGWLDHFRAFAATWHVPAGAPTAKSAPFTFFTPHYDIAREYSLSF
jgi:hypothetical protein